MALTRTITTRDLLLRVVPPRFLTERDEVRVPAIVHNYQEGGAIPITVKVLPPSLTVVPTDRPSLDAYASLRIAWRASPAPK